MDFESLEGEQHLHINLIRTKQELDSWLDDQGWDGVLENATEISSAEFLHNWTRFLTLPMDAPQFDVSWIERGWQLNDDWDDATFVGEGQGRWLALNWFITA